MGEDITAIKGSKSSVLAPGGILFNVLVSEFNGKLRNELPNGELFYTLREAHVLIGRWRHHYNRIRHHSALGYRPPAPETAPLTDLFSSTDAENQMAA